MRELTRLRAACEARLADVAVPHPFDLDTFCRSIAGHRGRPMHLHTVTVPAGPGQPFALWLGADDADHVFVDAAATGWHRDHLVCHEIGHMLFDHMLVDRTAESGGTADATRLLMPDLDPAMVRRVLARHAYDTRQEREAELTATLILERARRRPAGPFDALDAAFGRGAGW
ncbi:MAG: hypothetical protein HOV79_12390 [Hamadaea sp.]|nr:hypothetical protein [Hamadaea sp.]